MEQKIESTIPKEIDGVNFGAMNNIDIADVDEEVREFDHPEIYVDGKEGVLDDNVIAHIEQL